MVFRRIPKFADDYRRFPKKPKMFRTYIIHISESRVQSPESRVQSPESRVQSPESRVQSPESRVQSRVQSPVQVLDYAGAGRAFIQLNPNA